MTKFYSYFLLILSLVLRLELATAQNTVVTAAPAVSNICVGAGYTTLGTIYIAETNFANFNNGPNQQYILSVPANFEFNTSATPSVTTNAGSGISSISASAPTLTTFTFSYSVSPGSTSAGPLDSLIITGIQLRAVTAPSSGSLARSGGDAIQAGNAVGAQVHCALTSLSGVSITTQPTDNNVCATLTNQTIFTVAASGSGLSYSWERDNLNSGDGTGFDPISTAAPGSYGGYNTATLTNNTNNTSQNGFLFRCVISGGCSGPVTSNTATLSVASAASVTSNPGNKSVCTSGGTATFTVAGNNTTVYQWQEKIGAGSFADISNTGVYSGATSATLTITNPPVGMSGRFYRCNISNNICSTQASSNSATLTVNTSPSISTQPADETACVNNSPTFGVVASGTGITYQWQRSNDAGVSFQNAPSAYSNTTTATMTADNVISSQNGYLFQCVVSSPSCGSVTSSAATLTVYSSGTVSYFGLDGSYCRNSSEDTLQGFPVGGVFSGPGVGATNPLTGKAAYSPLLAGAAGSKSIIYTLGCAISHSTTINDTTNIAYTSPANASPSFFTTDPPVDLVVETAPTPTGPIASGTFTGTGVSGTKFYPTLVAAGGPYPVLFTYTNPSGCTSKVTKGITVTSPGRNIPLLQAGSPFCQNSAAVLLDESTVQGGSPVFTPGFYEFEGYTGTGISSLGGTAYKFSPTVAGSYVINYNVRVWTLVSVFPFTFEWRTSIYASQTVTVNTVTPIDFNLPTSACNVGSTIDMTPFPGVLAGLSPNVLTKFTILSPASPPAGLLSGANNTIFDPSVVSTTTLFTVRYTFYGSACPTILDKQINVFTKPPVPTVYTPNTFWQSQNEEYCLGASRKILGATDDVTGLNPDYSSTYTWKNNANVVISNFYYLFPVSSDNAPGTYHYFVTGSVGGCTSDPLDVVMKINDKATVSAGPPQTICSGNTVTLAGGSIKFTSGAPLAATWYSPSSGGFSPDVNNLGAVYTPTSADISTGYVDLVIRSDDPDGTGPCPIDTQVVKITIKPAASVSAGPDMTYCSNSSVILSGQPLGSASSITWSGGAGSIVNPGLLTTVYNATTGEKSNNTIVFTATTNDPDGPSGPCPVATDQVSITISDQASVNAGPTQTICSGNTVTLAGGSVKLNSGAPLAATWYSPTSGSFSPSANTLSAIYTPTVTDSANGYVDLVLRSADPDGVLPCLIDTQVVRVRINQAAKVNAGADSIYCSNKLITLYGSTSGSASSLTWSGGGGTISNPTFPQTSYTATTAEKSGNTVIFTATTNDPDGPLGPCLAVTDQVNIKINEQANVNAGVDQKLCRSKAITKFDLNGLSELTFSHSSLAATWSGGLGNFSNNSSLTSAYTPHVSEIPADGTFNNLLKLYLTTADPDGTGPCLAVKDSLILTVNPLPDVKSVIIPSNSLCKTPTSASFLLGSVVATNYGGNGIFSDTTTVVPGVSGNYFLPSAAGVGQHRIYHIYTDGNGCKNYHDTLINVYGIPRPKFTIAEYCATKPTYFNASASDIIDFSNSSIDPNSTITSYSWIFGNNNTIYDTSTAKITNYVYDKTLDPSAKQTFTVTIKLGTDHGCFAQEDSVITVGNIPSANFSWSKICPADAATLFKDISLFPPVEVNKYSWDFNDGSIIQTGPGMISGNPNTTDENPSHKMVNGTGVYNVKFKILTNIGCADSITYKVNILDEYTPTTTNPYSKNFASADGFWSVDGQNPSWKWGTANKTNISTGTRNVWVTNTVGTYNASEKSYLNGPCLNFSGLSRPMITLKINSATQNQIAGAVLQSSSDGGTTWEVVGAMGSGINWYDNFGVLGNPGNQTVNQFAWTGTYPDWKISKINLNSLAGNSSVRLRLAFGSGQDTLNLKDGFALDSIWVGNRDKVLLAENFTNSSTSSVVVSDTKLNSLVNSRWNDLVAIHYHTGFPGTDVMNLRDQADPSSRVLHYGVPKVPYIVFDGNYNYGTELDADDVDRRSLDPARFKLKMSTDITNTKVSALIRIIAADSISNNFVLHATVVERFVPSITGANSQTNFEWVATRMLPNAGGTYFSQDFNKNDSVDVNINWNYSLTEVYDPTQLGIVAFIQDVSTKEVYQAIYKLGTASITSGLKNQLLSGKQLFVYPNPSNNATNIILEEASSEDLEYSLHNELGQVVDRGIVLKGTTEFPINTSGIPNGMYVVKIGNDIDGMAFKKIIVAH